MPLPKYSWFASVNEKKSDQSPLLVEIKKEAEFRAGKNLYVLFCVSIILNRFCSNCKQIFHVLMKSDGRSPALMTVEEGKEMGEGEEMQA